jgi:hypothetical protein
VNAAPLALKHIPASGRKQQAGRVLSPELRFLMADDEMNDAIRRGDEKAVEVFP